MLGYLNGLDPAENQATVKFFSDVKDEIEIDAR